MFRKQKLQRYKNADIEYSYDYPGDSNLGSEIRRKSIKQRTKDIKTKIIERTGFDEVMVVDDTALSGASSEYNTIKDNIVYKQNR